MPPCLPQQGMALEAALPEMWLGAVGSKGQSWAPAQSKDTAHPEQVAAHTPLSAPASPGSSPQRQTPLVQPVFEVFP